MKKGALRLILWDHLSPDIPTLQNADPKHDRILFLETIGEASYVNHHVKKLAFLFSAMRHFAEELKEKGYKILYTEIASKEATLTTGVLKALKEFPAERIVVTEPGEYRILKEINSWPKKTKIPVEILPDARFFFTREEFSSWAQGKKRLLMEHFYQQGRKKTGLLMDRKGDPLGGKWNYDEENRNPLRTKPDIEPPPEIKSDPITKKVLEQVKTLFSKHFGDLLPFWFAVTRKDAEKAFRFFLTHHLPHFGPYQDAMLSDEPFLYHSVISHYLNAGLLDPKKVCEEVHEACLAKKIPLASAEGYIRQILGWREYVRGVYWLKMPAYAKLNFFNAKRKLPWFYWSGETEMNCLKQAIAHTKEHAYSHHIQRLMITGNFALLIGVLPKEICDWYLSVYADAHEWVELPNTLGMSQFADGGFLATKPYASSGSYIDRMSDFCKSCAYSVKEKEGAKACPFNYLYWDFLLRNEKKLKSNIRLAMAYKTLKGFSAAKKKQIRQDAKRFMDSLE